MKTSNILVTVLTTATITSCGTANLNRIFGSKDNSTSALMERAQLAYDKGELDKAEEYATSAYNNSDNNGEPAVLLGSIMLSKAGVDIFNIVQKMADLSDTSKKTTTTTTTTDTCASTSTDAAATLSTLSCKLLSLTSDDIAKLGATVKLTSTYFSPVTSYYSPNAITDDLRQSVNVLKYTDRGIKYLCPFVNRDRVTGISSDTRHALSTCGDKSGSSYNSGKIHIGFALLHLVETLVYQRSILGEGTSSTSGGIATMSSKLSAASFGTDISGFVTTVNEFKTMVDAIADTGSASSQLSLTLDGLTVVANSFAEAGVPAKIIATITTSLASIKATAAKLAAAAGSVSSTTYQTQALKGQISQKYSAVVATKINSVCGSDGKSCTAEQQTQICSSYSSISQGVDPSKSTKPTWCP